MQRMNQCSHHIRVSRPDSGTNTRRRGILFSRLSIRITRSGNCLEHHRTRTGAGSGVFAAAVHTAARGLAGDRPGRYLGSHRFPVFPQSGRIVSHGIHGRIREFRNRRTYPGSLASPPNAAGVPIWINVSPATLDGAVELAQDASSAGVAGLSSCLRTYFRYSQDEILAFYRKYNTAARVNVPTLLYHIPVFNMESPSK